MRIDKIAIASHEQVIYLNSYEILYCDSRNPSIVVEMVDGRVIAVNKQLTQLQRLLPNFFIRVSQCVLINKLYLCSILKKEKIVCLQGGIEFKFTMPISKLVERIGKISSDPCNTYSENDKYTEETMPVGLPILN